MVCAEVTAPTAVDNLVFNGNEQELVTAGSTNFGKVLYSLDGETYSEEVPKGTSAGDYTVFYKVEGSDNWNAVDAATVEVTIAESYTITWKNGDETLETDNYVPGGATPEYNGETPTKAGEDNEVFVFNGWDSEPAAVTGDMTYTAQFIKYTKVSETLATYTSAGNSEYYTCEDGKYYILSNGEFVEVAEGSWILPELEKTEVIINSVDINGTATPTTVYAETFTAADYTVPSAPYLDGYDFKGWTVNDTLYTTADEVQTAVETLVKSGTAVTVKVDYEKKTETHTVNVVDGTLVDKNQTSDTYEVADIVYVVANEAPEGQRFDHWEKNGAVVGYDTSYSFPMPSEDVTITAVYAADETPVEKKGTAYIESVTKVSGNKLVFVSILSVPENCRIVSAGLVATNDDTIGADICAESVTTNPTKKVFVKQAAGSNRNVKYTWTKSNVSADETWYVKAYLVYIDTNGNTQTVYGDLVTASIN